MRLGRKAHLDLRGVCCLFKHIPSTLRQLHPKAAHRGVAFHAVGHQHALGGLGQEHLEQVGQGGVGGCVRAQGLGIACARVTGFRVYGSESRVWRQGKSHTVCFQGLGCVDHVLPALPGGRHSSLQRRQAMGMGFCSTKQLPVCASTTRAPG